MVNAAATVPHDSSLYIIFSTVRFDHYTTWGPVANPNPNTNRPTGRELSENWHKPAFLTLTDPQRWVNPNHN